MSLSNKITAVRATLAEATGFVLGIGQIGASGKNSGQNTGPDQLEFSPGFFDFGKISMSAGLVEQDFIVTNSSSEPAILAKLSTSCMCTSAELLAPAGNVGPFGMPSHGGASDFSLPLLPGEPAVVRVVFDPAAHGPAGLGKVSRTVTLETVSGQRLVMAFSALVTP